MTSDKTQMKLQRLQNTVTNAIYTMQGSTYEMIQYMSLYNILVIKLVLTPLLLANDGMNNEVAARRPGLVVRWVTVHVHTVAQM